MKLDSCGDALEHLDTSGSNIMMSEPTVPNLKKIGSLPLFIRFFSPVYSLDRETE